MFGMEPQPMKGLGLAESSGSSKEFTSASTFVQFYLIISSLFHCLDSGNGPSHLKRKRSTSESAIWGMKRRRTTSWEQPPTPNGSSQVKIIETKEFPYETSVSSLFLPLIACAYGLVV